MSIKQTKQSKVTKQSNTISKSAKVKEVVAHIDDDEDEEIEVAEVAEVEIEEAEEAEEAEEVEVEVDADIAETEADTISDKKKPKKIDFNCEKIEEALNELMRIDNEIEQACKTRKNEFKALQRLVLKLAKLSKKRKHNTSDITKEATGFIKAKAVPLKFKNFYEYHFKDDIEFKKLYNLFNINENQPRTDITKIIYHYIRSNELYGKKDDGTTDKRSIIPDKYLIDLLSIKDNEKIGFNNFQSYVSRLYESEKIKYDTDIEDNNEENNEDYKPIIVKDVLTKNTSKGKKSTHIMKT
jgi:hypothetical protein